MATPIPKSGRRSNMRPDLKSSFDAEAEHQKLMQQSRERIETSLRSLRRTTDVLQRLDPQEPSRPTTGSQ